MSGIEQIFRWLHIFAGVMWIGLLYYFNFVNGAFAATLDGDTKKKVIPELMPRALYWFRMGALWTWVTGFVLLLLIFYHGRNVLEGDAGWSLGTLIMILVTFLSVFVYDLLFKSALGKDLKIGAAIGFVYTAIVMILMDSFGNFSYRGYNIHVGAMFGTIMAFNVWFRIWPAQQKIVTAIKNGEAPDSALVALAGSRSKHNTYLSVPLFWTMINGHTTFFAGGNWGLTSGTAWISTLVFILLGWHLVARCYKISANVKGF